MSDTRIPGPRALLLDALGTLVELQPPAPALRTELARRFGVQVELDEAARALRAEISYYRAHLQQARDAPSLAALRRRCAEVLRDALPPSARLHTVSIDALTPALLAALRFRAYDDARPALLAARARGRRIVVVSNWDVSLEGVLERVGLAALIDGVVTSAVIGARKPAPAIFEAALRIADVRPDHALHVGDSLEEDIDGARAAGLRAVLLRRDGDAGVPGVPAIASLSELDSLLVGMGAAADEP
jgi:putative hydrolase of the HAD superfamily